MSARPITLFLLALALAASPALGQGGPVPLDPAQYAVVPLGSGRIAFVGTAEPGALVELLLGGGIVARAVANERGEWLLTPPEGATAGAAAYSLRVTIAGAPEAASGAVAVPTPPTLADFAIVVTVDAGGGAAAAGAIGYPRLATVLRGDSPWRLAERYYGDGTLYPLIVEANRAAIREAGTLLPGMILLIPDPAAR